MIEHDARMRKESVAYRLRFAINNSQVVAHRTCDPRTRCIITRAGQFDAAVLRNKGRLGKLGGIIEVAKLRRCEWLPQISCLAQDRAGDTERKLIRIARLLAADFVKMEIERDRGLANLQGSRRMQNQSGLAGT